MAWVADLSGNYAAGISGPETALGQKYPLAALRPVTNFAPVAYTGTAGNTSPFNNTVQQVSIQTTSASFYNVGPGVTATTSDIPLAANTLIYIKVRPGDRVSAVQQSVGGNLHVSAVR